MSLAPPDSPPALHLTQLPPGLSKLSGLGSVVECTGLGQGEGTPVCVQITCAVAVGRGGGRSEVLLLQV